MYTPAARFLPAVCGLLLASLTAAQGRVPGQAQTLDDVRFPQGQIEQDGAVAARDGVVVCSSLTSVAAGSDVAQVFSERSASPRLYPDAVLEAVPGGAARTFGSAVAIGGGRVVVADARATNSVGEGVLDTWRVGALGVNDRGRLAPPEATAAKFGAALAIDDDRLAVLSRAQGTDAVRVYVYRAVGAVDWILEATVAVVEQPGDPAPFGESVHLDGDRLVIGAPWRNSGQGAALVYRRVQTSWSLEAELRPAGLLAVGGAVALDGSQLLVFGAEPIGLGSRGVVVALRSVTGTWVEQQRLVPPASTLGDQFGASLALSGGIAAIAAPGRPRSPGVLEPRGAVDVWTRDPLSGTWSFASELIDGDAAAGDVLGLDVALDSGTSPVRVVALGRRRGHVQAQAVRLPSPLPSQLVLRETAGVATCAPNAINSLGTWAKLRARGSSVLTGDPLLLEAWDLPAQTWLALAAAPNSACSPIAAGQLALGPSPVVARWAPQLTGASGVAFQVVDLGGLPTQAGALAVVAGETWSFQAIYRDTVGGRLSEGLRVRFDQ